MQCVNTTLESFLGKQIFSVNTQKLNFAGIAIQRLGLKKNRDVLIFFVSGDHL